ncbi:MAG: HAMP domain-containing sensor histidine kinase [Candidatus Woykebacteria bacterium]
MLQLPKFVLKSLRVKFALVLLIILFLVFSVSSGVLIYRSLVAERANLIDQARAFAKLSAKPIGNTYSLYYDSGYLKFKGLIGETLSLNTDIEKIEIISVTGDILFDSKDLKTGKRAEIWKTEDKNILDKVAANVGSEVPLRTKTSTPNQLIEPYIEDFGAHPFSIRYFLSYDSISQNVLYTILTTLLLSSIFFIGSIILIVLVVNRTILNPIEMVIKGAKKISSGDLSHAIKVNTNDEVEDLAVAVNQMAQTLKKNIEDLKELDRLKDEFVFLASHNLRTPLTIIKGYVSSLLEETSLVKADRDKISKISDSTRQLESMAETLLSLVSLEKGQEVLKKTQVDLGKLLEEIAGKFGKETAKKKISFIFELPSDPVPQVAVEKNRITQAFASLIDNAIKFNKEGGKVTVRIEKREKELVVSVKDEGIGILEKEKDKVFKKFHRATDVLTYNYGGIGLGLYLTKLITEAHGGRIWFDSKVGEGSSFYISLPLSS